MRVQPVKALGLFVLATWLEGCGGWHMALRPYTPHHAPASCERVADLPSMGVEDIAPDPKTGSFYVSVADWRELAKNSFAPGAIYKLTTDGRGGLSATNVTPPMTKPFFPHGLSVWRPEGEAAGKGRLFAVNHGDGKGPSRIEMFDIEEGGALTWSSDSSEQLRTPRRPNDVAAIGRRAFYVTNDHSEARKSWFKPGPHELWEDAVGRRTASIVFIDLDAKAPGTPTPAAFPNGIQTSRDGKTVVVTESTRGAIRIFSAGEDGRLMPKEVRQAPRLPDNLYLQDDRYLWVAVHRNAVSFGLHALSWKEEVARPPSPGRVLRFDLRDPKSEPLVVYETTKRNIEVGQAMSAISAAVPVGDKLLVASIFEGLQLCEK